MCTFVMMRINALLDDELDEEAADHVREHLSVCETCLDEIEIWSAIRSAVKHAYAPQRAPQSLIDRVSAHLRQPDQA
jgi:mycothiol system anti-sigma-R factor